MQAHNKLTALALTMLSFFPVAVTAQSAGSTATYTNPVLNRNFPDPSVIYGRDHYFYAYATDGNDKERPLSNRVISLSGAQQALVLLKLRVLKL